MLKGPSHLSEEQQVSQDLKTVVELPENTDEWPSYSVITAAITRLKRTSNKAELIQFSQKWSSHPAATVRASAANVLASYYGAETVVEKKSIQEFLNDSKQQVRMATLRGLQESATQESLDFVISTLESKNLGSWERMLIGNTIVRQSKDANQIAKHMGYIFKMYKKDTSVQDDLRLHSKMSEMLNSAHGQNKISEELFLKLKK